MFRTVVFSILLAYFNVPQVLAQDVGLYSGEGAYFAFNKFDQEFSGSVIKFDTAMRLVEAPATGRVLSDGAKLMLGTQSGEFFDRSTAVYVGDRSDFATMPMEWTLLGQSSGEDSFPILLDYSERSVGSGQAIAGVLLEGGLVEAGKDFAISRSAVAAVMPGLRAEEDGETLGFASVADFALETYTANVACSAAVKTELEFSENVCQIREGNQVPVVAPKTQAAFYRLAADTFGSENFGASPLDSANSIVTSSTDALVAIGKSTDWSFQLASLDLSQGQALTGLAASRRNTVLEISSPPETFFHEIAGANLGDNEINSQVEAALSEQSNTNETCSYYLVDSAPVIVCLNHTDDFGMGERPFWVLSNFVILSVSIDATTGQVEALANAHFGIQYGLVGSSPRSGTFDSVRHKIDAEAKAVGFVMDRFSSSLRTSYPEMVVR